MISKIHKEPIKFKIKKAKNPIKNRQRPSIGIFKKNYFNWRMFTFWKKTSRWTEGQWKGTQHQWSPGMCKLKPKWDASSHLLILVLKNGSSRTFWMSHRKLGEMYYLGNRLSSCNRDTSNSVFNKERSISLSP